jgi:hypothetical protein
VRNFPKSFAETADPIFAPLFRRTRQQGWASQSHGFAIGIHGINVHKHVFSLQKNSIRQAHGLAWQDSDKSSAESEMPRERQYV